MKYFLGILSILPLLYIVVFFALFISAFVHIASGGNPGSSFLVFFPTLIVVHFAMILLIFGLIIYYCILVMQNEMLDENKKLLWMVLIIIGNTFALPFYWYFHIYKQGNKTNLAKEKSLDTSTDTYMVITAVLLLTFYPAGVITMWMWLKKWPIWVKILITLPVVLFILLFIVVIGLFFIFLTSSTNTKQMSLETRSIPYNSDISEASENWNNGNFSTSLQLASKALTEAITPGQKAEAHYWIGMSYVATDNVIQGTSEENFAISLNPSYFAPYAALSSIALSENNNNQALIYANKSITLNPTYDWAHNDKGLALFALGNKSEAIQELTYAHSLDPMNMGIEKNLESVENQNNSQASPSHMLPYSSTPQ